VYNIFGEVIDVHTADIGGGAGAGDRGAGADLVDAGILIDGP
jgi:hypothetical protein